MPVTYEEAVRIRDVLGDNYGGRLESLKRLREFWHGNFWDQPEATGGFMSLFREGASDTGPDVKVVRNFVHQICVKYQTFLSPLPMVTVPIDPPMTKRSRDRSVLKERALYGLWEEGNMAHYINKLAWYLPLMGDGYLGIWPDFDRSIVRPLVRSPEYAYPVPGYDATNPCALDAVIFSWSVDAEYAKRSFPKWRPRPKVTHGRFRFPGTKRRSDEEDVEILEWSDTKCFQRFVDGQLVNGVEHNLGFNLFDQAQFIHVPDEPHGHGAVEQIVNLNELTNATMSLLFQAVYENVYPTMVLVDPAKAPEEIMRGPGAVIPVNAGGGVEWLHPPVAALGAQLGYLSEIERAMKEEAAMPDVNFGVSPASSIVTGKAINELQGAGTGSTIEMVQGTGLGTTLVSWNAKALTMLRRMFGDEKIRLGGYMPMSFADLNPRSFALTFRGSELVGSTRNRVVFSPAIDQHTKLVMQLQARGAGLISKGYAREQIGIPDSEAMEEEILGETLMDGVLAGLLADMQQGMTPEQAEGKEQQGFGYLSVQPPSGGTPLPELPPGLDPSMVTGPPPPVGAPPGLPGLPAGPAGPPANGGAPGGGGMPPLPPEVMAALGGGGVPPGGAPAPPLEGGAPPEGGEEPVTLEQAMQMFNAVPESEGRVFLIGEIVQLGVAMVVEVAITAPNDRETLASALPSLTGRLSFKRVPGEPDEPYVEVTPGVEPTPGGAEPDLAGFLNA